MLISKRTLLTYSTSLLVVGKQPINIESENKYVFIFKSIRKSNYFFVIGKIAFI